MFDIASRGIGRTEAWQKTAQPWSTQEEYEVAENRPYTNSHCLNQCREPWKRDDKRPCNKNHTAMFDKGPPGRRREEALPQIEQPGSTKEAPPGVERGRAENHIALVDAGSLPRKRKEALQRKPRNLVDMEPRRGDKKRPCQKTHTALLAAGKLELRTNGRLLKQQTASVAVGRPGRGREEAVHKITPLSVWP